MEEHTSATVVGIREDRKVLMQFRDSGNGKPVAYPLMWHIPGGSKEENESYIEAALREMKEEFELIIDSSHCRLIYVYDHDSTIGDHVFACEIEGKKRIVLHEGAAFGWFTIGEFKELQLGFHQASLLDAIETYLHATKIEG